MNHRDFNPNKYQCRKCDTVIMSSFPGQYVSCKCGAIAVDQTEYYVRLIGEQRNILPYGED